MNKRTSKFVVKHIVNNFAPFGLGELGALAFPGVAINKRADEGPLAITPCLLIEDRRNPTNSCQEHMKRSKRTPGLDANFSQRQPKHRVHVSKIVIFESMTNKDSGLRLGIGIKL